MTEVSLDTIFDQLLDNCDNEDELYITVDSIEELLYKCMTTKNQEITQARHTRNIEDCYQAIDDMVLKPIVYEED